jgi:Tfp pilus assembly protein PilN
VIDTNLATRPFYNERAVRLWLMVAALAVGAATVFNVSRVLYYSRSDTTLASAAARDEQRVVELRRAAADLRGSVDPRQVDAASSEARRANELIDRRTFSWTALFNQFEATLPPDVRITSVRPRIGPRGVVLTVTVLARGVPDVDAFMENLEATGAFAELLARDERVLESGQLEAALETVYVPAAAPAPATGAPPATGPSEPAAPRKAEP